MVQVIKHEPEPVTPPPVTYDILGLTEEEAMLLTAIISFTDCSMLSELWRALCSQSDALYRVGWLPDTRPWIINDGKDISVVAKEDAVRVAADRVY